MGGGGLADIHQRYQNALKKSKQIIKQTNFILFLVHSHISKLHVYVYLYKNLSKIKTQSAYIKFLSISLIKFIHTLNLTMITFENLICIWKTD